MRHGVKYLAMVFARKGYYYRYRLAYLPPAQIQSEFRSAKFQPFFSGIYGIRAELSPESYDTLAIQGIPLIGDCFIDIDAHSQEQRRVFSFAAKQAINRLKELGVPYLLWFSGNGIHIQIPCTIESPELPLIHRAFATEISPHADLCLFEPSRVIRYPFSFNTNAQAFKVPINDADLDLPFHELRKKALVPTGIVPVIQYDETANHVMLDIYNDYQRKIDEIERDLASDVEQQEEFIENERYQESKGRRLVELPEKDAISQRALHILTKYDIEIGTRHRNTIFLAYDLRQAKHDQETTKKKLIQWAKGIKERNLSRSDWQEIRTDTNLIVDHVFKQEKCWRPLQFLVDTQRDFSKMLRDGKRTKRFKEKPNQNKVLYALSAAAKNSPNSKFFLSYTMIQSLTGLCSLRNRRTNYVKRLIEEKYVETIPSYEVEGFIERPDGLAETMCYHYLR